MSLKQIPNLPSVVALTGAEEFEGVQNGVSVKITSAQIASLVNGAGVRLIDTTAPITGGPITGSGTIGMNLPNDASLYLNGLGLFSLPPGGGGGTVWGGITGTLSNQTDLQAVLDTFATGGGTATGVNTGDQDTIVGISGTKAEFDAELSDGSFLYVGDVTQYTDEMAQDAVGAMVDTTLVYVDGTPLLTRAALTGDVAAAQGSNTLTIGANAVGNAKLATMAANTVKANATAGAAVPTDVALAASQLFGRGATGDIAPITLGTNLSMTGATLNATGGGSAAWGSITGTLSAQTDLDTALNGKQPLDADLTTIAGLTATTDNFMQAKAGAWASRTVAQVKTDLNLAGTNTGDQSSIVGISGTKAQFDAELSDGNFLYVGDITQYTDEMAQDAVGSMVDASLTYVDGTPLLQRSALTGDVAAAAGSNSTTLATVNANVGSFGLAASVAQFTVNAKGLITAAANVAISIASTAISDSTAAGRAFLTAATAAAQTALLDVFTSGAKGLAPASGGGTTNFLRADGTWVAPTSSVAWGAIAGTLSSQTDLNTALSGKQPLDADLTTIAGLTATTDNFMQAKAGAWASRTVAQVKTDLAITAGDVSGLGALALLNNVTTLDIVNGAVTAPKIGDGEVTNAKLATMAANSVKVNATNAAAIPTNLIIGASELLGRGSTGDIAALTLGTNLSMSGTTLNAAGGSGSPGGSTTQVQYNNAGAFAGAAEVEIEGNQLRLESTSSFTTPATGGVKLIGLPDASRTVPGFLSQDGLETRLQESLAYTYPLIWKAQPGSTAFSVIGGAVPTAVGTATLAAIASTSLFTRQPKVEYLVTVAATTAIAGFRGVNLMASVGAASAGQGGFTFVGRWGPATGVATTTNRAFFGLANITSAPTDVEPSTVVNCVFMGWDAADANVQIMHNDAAGACTKIDLGASFAVPTTDRTQLYELQMYSPQGTTQSVDYRVVNINTGAVASGTITTNLPSTTTFLAPRGWVSVGGTSSVIGIGVGGVYLKPLLD